MSYFRCMIRLTLVEKLMLLWLALREAWIAFLGCREAAIYIVWGHTSRVLIRILIENFYVLLYVACPLVFWVIIREAMDSSLEQRLFRAEGWFNFVLGACRDLFPNLIQPERPVAGHFLTCEYFWLMVRIDRFERAWDGMSVSEVWPWFVYIEAISVWAEWRSNGILLL